jgi:hypothetical protein
MMLRTVTISCGLMLAGFLSAAEANAAPGGPGRSFAQPNQMRMAMGGRHGLARRAVVQRGFRHGHRLDRGFAGGPGFAGGLGFFGPYYPYGDDGRTVVVREEQEPAKVVDRNSFENMPARAGIMRSPTPEPTLYRIEGPRNRPVTRVIRINDPEPRDGRRSRFAHAETGALLLTVPGR